MMFGPTQPLIVDDGLVVLEQLVRALADRSPAPGSGDGSFKKSSCRHSESSSMPNRPWRANSKQSYSRRITTEESISMFGRATAYTLDHLSQPVNSSSIQHSWHGPSACVRGREDRQDACPTGESGIRASPCRNPPKAGIPVPCQGSRDTCRSGGLSTAPPTFSSAGFRRTNVSYHRFAVCTGRPRGG